MGIVVAAGQASRFGAGVPKQFRSLAGVSLLERAVRLLAADPAVRGVVVVLAGAELAGERARALARLPGVVSVVAGGAERADSVRNGLAAAGSARFVLVHDAARPLASGSLVRAVIEATRRHGAAIPGLPVPDTVKRVEAEPGFVHGFRVGETLDRQALRLAQTPQGARADWLRVALERSLATASPATDEAAALERVGYPVAVVPGETQNRKITTPLDLEQASRELGDAGAPELRVGCGFDVHRFGGTRPLVLGGVTFPGEPGLAGHSDADVILHAAMDSLLGAAGLPDIGSFFPPDDARFGGADSRELAAEIARRVAAEHFELVNLDLTLLAERPRIRERVGEMRQAIATSLGVPIGRIGLKATTLEGLGALGRGAGVACQAVALLRRSATGSR